MHTFNPHSQLKKVSVIFFFSSHFIHGENGAQEAKKLIQVRQLAGIDAGCKSSFSDSSLYHLNAVYF